MQARDIDGNTKFVPMPPNQQTVNMLFHENITSKEEMVDWLDKRRPSRETGGQGAQDVVWCGYTIQCLVRIPPS